MQKIGAILSANAPFDGPLFNLGMASVQTDPADSEKIHKLNDGVTRTQAEAAKTALDYDFIYVNNASEHRDVISSYGGANQRKPRSVCVRICAPSE